MGGCNHNAGYDESLLLMKCRPNKAMIVLTCCAFVAAGSGWIVWRTQRPRADLLNTDALVVQDLAWHVDARRCVVRGALMNRSSRAAISAIVVLEMRDGDGNVVATNPMIEVVRVPGRTATLFEGVLSVPQHLPEQVAVTATVAAARWE